MLKKIIAITTLTLLVVSCSSPKDETVVVPDERKSLNLTKKIDNIENKKELISFNLFSDSKDSLKDITGKLMGITLNEKGEIFLLDQETHKLLKFSPDGTFTTEYGSEGSEEDEFNEPKYIVSNNNKIYIADTWNNRIKIVNAKDEVENLIYSSFFGPKGISIFNNKLYVADTGNHQIKVFNDTSDLVNTISQKGKSKKDLHEPTGLTHDNEGNLYIVDSMNNRICVYDNNDKINSCWYIKGWEEDNGGKECWISYYDNKLYLGDPVNNSVRVFTKNGKELKPIIKGLNSISGITIKDGKIYAIDFVSNEIIVKDINRK